jgi:type II secretory pathway pseudopilin PulG
MPKSGQPTGSGHDDGFALAALIIFLTALSIALAAAAPAYQMQAQREVEQELIFRGQEYVRAIQKYQRSFGIFPPNVESLLDTNGIRFLRRPYTDPITGEGFRLLTVNPDGSINGSTMYQQLAGGGDLFQGGTPQMFGEGQSSQPFGAQQPGGFSGAGGGGLTGQQQGQGGGQPRGGQGGQGGGAGGQGGFNTGGFGSQAGGGGQGGGFGQGGAQSGFGGQQTGFGQSVNPNAGAQTNTGQGFGGGGGGGGFGQQNSGFGQSGVGQGDGGGRGAGQQGRAGQGGFGGTGQGGGFSGSPTGTTPTTSIGAGGGSFGSTNIAGGGLVGVAPQNEDPSLIAYNRREVYNEWEFIALPGFGTVPMTQGIPGQTGQPGTGAQNPFGQSQASPFGQGQGASPGASTTGR